MGVRMGITIRMARPPPSQRVRQGARSIDGRSTTAGSQVAACEVARRQTPRGTWRVRKARSLALGIALAAATSVGATQPLAIRVSPAVAFAPNLIVRATLEPDRDNREM